MILPPAVVIIDQVIQDMDDLPECPIIIIVTMGPVAGPSLLLGTYQQDRGYCG